LGLKGSDLLLDALDIGIQLEDDKYINENSCGYEKHCYLILNLSSSPDEQKKNDQSENRENKIIGKVIREKLSNNFSGSIPSKGLKNNGCY